MVDKFGAEYPALIRSTDGIDGFLARNSMVGLCPAAAGIDVYAPHGFDDVEAMLVRPNRVPNFQSQRYLAKAERWKAQWPEITVLAP